MRSKWFHGIAVIVVAAGVGAIPASAQIGGGVFVCSNCSTEPTQISIKLMHDLEYAKQLLQYAIQVEQLADAIKNTTHGGPATLTNVAADIGMLANVVQGGQALAYSLGNQDVLFHQTYPGYQWGGPGGMAPAGGTYASKYAMGLKQALIRHKVSCEAPGFRGNCWRPNKACWEYCGRSVHPTS